MVIFEKKLHDDAQFVVYPQARSLPNAIRLLAMRCLD